MLSYQDRLREAMADAQIGRSRLAADLGISYQAVRKVLEGETKTFSASNNTRAALLLGVNPHWLATGEGAKVTTDGNQPGAGNDLLPIPPSRFKQVWVVGRGSGGVMPERLWTDGDQPVGITEEFAEVATMDPHAFLAEVKGPSMVPRYNPGEFALVEPSTEPDIEDDVLVRLADGQTLLKRLLSRRGGLRLGSYNDDQVLFFEPPEVSWVYYVAHPVPRRRIKNRI